MKKKREMRDKKGLEGKGDSRKVTWNDHVGSSTWGHNLWEGGIVHLSHGVSERPGGIDDTL